MPELHKLTPPLSVLQKKGFRVALVTDGRMSGASGSVPAAIHCSPECLEGRPPAKVRHGCIVPPDAPAGTPGRRVEPRRAGAGARAERAQPPIGRERSWRGGEVWSGVWGGSLAGGSGGRAVGGGGACLGGPSVRADGLVRYAGPFRYTTALAPPLAAAAMAALQTIQAEPLRGHARLGRAERWRGGL